MKFAFVSVLCCLFSPFMILFSICSSPHRPKTPVSCLLEFQSCQTQYTVSNQSLLFLESHHGYCGYYLIYFWFLVCPSLLLTSIFFCLCLELFCQHVSIWVEPGEGFGGYFSYSCDQNTHENFWKTEVIDFGSWRQRVQSWYYPSFMLLSSIQKSSIITCDRRWLSLLDL